MASLSQNKQNKKNKRRGRSSLSSTESTGSPDQKKLKNLQEEDHEQETHLEEDDEVLTAENMTKELNEKMDVILQKLTKLDSIEATLNTVQLSLENLQERTESLEMTQAEFGQEITELKRGKELQASEIKELSAKMEEVKTKNLYLEAYSRRENIKFINIEEDEDEQHNTEDILRRFLDEKLGFYKHDTVEIQRVHRNPARKDRRGMKTNKPRPILARFLRAKDVEKIMALGRELKGTNYQMYIDLPKEIIERRRAQIPTLKKARENNIPAKFSKAEPDKLYIRGQLWPAGKTLEV